MSIGEINKAQKILEDTNVYEIDGFEKLPMLYRTIFNNIKPFIEMIEKLSWLPKEPCFLLEISEENFRDKNYGLSLKYINECLKYRKKLLKKGEWRMKFVKLQRARTLFKLKKYREAFFVYRNLLQEKEDIDWEAYEICRKKIRQTSSK
jgi:hypothetical protein